VKYTTGRWWWVLRSAHPSARGGRQRPSCPARHHHL